MDARLNIGIVGAGIGGLALAALVARRGHAATVFDRFETPQPVGSGLVIQPVGQAVLAEVGALEAALAGGARVRRMRGCEAEHGRPVLDVRYDLTDPARFGLAIHRAALFEPLLAAARAAGADLVAGAEVTGVEGDRIVAAGRRHGPFDLIVDASGAGSVLSGLQARPLPYGAVWATVDWPETPLPRDELRQVYRRADRMIGVLPLGHGKAAIFWSLPAGGHDAWVARGVASWAAEAAALWPEFAPFAAQITAPDQMIMARYTHGTLRRPYTGRLVHIGDAAHRASPQLGQGANMALLDALALARAIEAAGVAGAPALYARARRWHTRVYQGMSAVFTPQYQSDSRWLPVLRDRVLFPLSQVPPAPRVLSAIVCGTMLPPTGRLREG